MPLSSASIPEEQATQPILEMRGICKRFPGVVALDHVDFSVQQGEIHSLIGQNGAGKSTLMKILAGLYAPNEGQILIAGRPVTIHSPREALRLGIGVVYQELSLLPNLSVADNIFLGREPGNRFLVDEARVRARAREVLEQLGVTGIGINTLVRDLPLAQRQLIEIAKVLSYEPRILVLDEPTAPLASDDTARLFAILQRLKAQGIAIIFISHRFREILQHCDRGTILRNGRVIRTLALQGVSEEELIEAMIGQEIKSFYRYEPERKPAVAADEVPALEVRDLTIGEKVRHVSFALRPGEIVGLTGLLGAGQNEVARALFGVQEGVSATFLRKGRPVVIDSPARAIALGICLLTENRKEEGLFLEMSVRENTTLPSLSRFRRWRIFIHNRREQQQAGAILERTRAVMRSLAARVWTLSGGNQQKTLVARWLLRGLDVLILIEPTRGVDVGAKAEIYQLLGELAREGRSILLVSTELPEILGLADRILVMYNGELLRTFTRDEAGEELLTAAIQGAGSDSHRHPSAASSRGTE
jgi:ribose transport system ATP-binding protein